MNKYLLFAVPILFDLELSQAQIPNGGFEWWEQVLNYEKPVGWSTNQDTLFSRFEKDTASIEGEYSLKIVPDVPFYSYACENKAYIHVDFISPLPSGSALIFYAKAIPLDPVQDSSVYLRIFVHTYNSKIPLGSYDWSASASLDNFTRIQIPFLDENIDEVFIRIYGGGSSPFDGPCLSRTIAWLDGMYIDSKTSDKFPVTPKQAISVYPNPSSGFINISNSIGQIIEYELYSLVGELLFKGEVDNGQLELNRKGIFLLKLIASSADHNFYYNKLIVVK